MTQIHNGRHTALIEGDFVVFIIGMRFNKLRKVRSWFPVVAAMPKMLSVLSQRPEKGLLAVRQARSGRTITLIQYWRSFEQLENFARDKDDPHLEPWRRFNQKVGASGNVGIFHETYKVSAGQHESIYSNMPRMGLAEAGELVPVARRGESARVRMDAPAA